MNKILIKGGTVIDPLTAFLELADLYIEGGIIKDIVPSFKGDTKDIKVIDAQGSWVVPGLIDLHVHFRDPGQTHKEDIETGLLAAARGGFTTVCTMANTVPVTDSPELIKYQLEKAGRAGLGRLLPVSAATAGLGGSAVVDVSENKAAGAAALSDDGKFIENETVLEKVFEEAAKYNMPVFAHCDDTKESECVARDVQCALREGARLHICHISTAASVGALRDGRKKGAGTISAEVTPHHFTLTVADLKDTNGKMSPPLRTECDRAAVIEALRDGTISVIATDHAPHTEAEKALGFEKAPNGVIGLETAVGLAVTELYHKSVLTEKQLIACFTSGPAKVLGRSELGVLKKGGAADVTVINPDTEWTIDSREFVSKSKNTPFDGRRVRGKIVATVCGGRIIYQN